MANVNIGAELQALPLGFLISAPLVEAIKAQALAAQTTADFLMNVTMTDDGSGGLKAVTVDFGFTQAVPDPTNPSTTIDRPISLSVPLLSIVQVPYLRINDLTINFEFKIRDVQSVSSQAKLSGSTTAETSSSFKGNLSAGGGLLKFLGSPGGSAEYQSNFKLTVNASATYQRTDRQTTDRSATFKMNLNAVQDPIPEGMQRVLEILASAISATGLPTPAPAPAPRP